MTSLGLPVDSYGCCAHTYHVCPRSALILKAVGHFVRDDVAVLLVNRL